MRHIFSLLSFLAAAIAMMAGEPADYKLEVLDFTELKVTDNINVDYHCSSDSAGWAYFTCDPDVASMLMFTNNKSCLHIQVANDGNVIEGLPTLHVYSSSLAKVENSSDSTLRVLSNVPVEKFVGRVVGNGTLVITNVDAGQIDASIDTGKGHIVIYDGKARKAKLSNTGTGTIEAGGLKANRVKVMLFGTGDVDCTALESLSTFGAGSGKVYYSGNPAKITNRSLGVKAFPVSSK